MTFHNVNLIRIPLENQFNMKPFIYVIAILGLFVRGHSQAIAYDAIEQTFVISGLNAPQAVGGSKNEPYWKYFWEFGDGHYSFNRSPQYCYSKPGTYTVRAYATPYYSYESSRSFVQQITVTDSGCQRNRQYNLGGFLNIETNASGELVPGHDVQVILDYSMPFTSTSSEGYLLFMYNSEMEKRDLKLDFYPLNYRRNEERAYEASAISNFSLDRIAQLLPSDRAKIQAQIDDHQVRAFSCTLAPGANNRLFLTLSAATALDTTIIKGKKGALITNIKAVWLPTGATFSSIEMTDHYDLRMLSVHDPNRIRIEQPRGFAYYNPRTPEVFQFKIDFQNKGGRPVRQVDIDIPWQRQFNYEQIEIIERDPANSVICPDCPEYFDPALDSISCFKVDTSRQDLDGKVRLTFYNVMIHGKNEKGVGGGKYTKGFVKYQVPSTKFVDRKSKIRADITFLGGETFRTGSANKKWREKTIGLKLGRNFNDQLEYFDRLDATADLKYWYNVGGYYKNAALFRGLGWGGELAVAGFGFESKTVNRTLNANGGTASLQFTQETIEWSTLDIQAQAEARILGILAAGVGGGVSIPLLGSGTINDSRYTRAVLPEVDFNETWARYEETGEIPFDEFINFPVGDKQIVANDFGLLQENTVAELNDILIESGNSIGGMVHWYLEAGLLRYGAIGLRQDFRIYPNSYKNQCIKFNNFEAYLRIKLASL